jgi:hypothetical protein
MFQPDQNLCTRCGEPAGDYRFCPSCGLQLSEVPTRSEAEASQVVELRPAPRFGELSVAGSNGLGERIREESPGLHHADVEETHDEPTAEFPAQAESEPADPEPLVAAEPEPAVALEPPPQVAWEPPPQVAWEPPVEVSWEAPEPEVAEPEPVVVAEPEPVVEMEPEPVLAPEPEPVAAPEPEPVLAEEPEVEAAVVEPDDQATPEPEVSWQPLESARSPRSSWVAALCLAALIGLVVLMTGRGLRREA